MIEQRIQDDSNSYHGTSSSIVGQIAIVAILVNEQTQILAKHRLVQGRRQPLLWRQVTQGYNAYMQLKTLILPLLFTLPLTGCSLVYKVDIPQGNYIEAKQVEQLRQGMSQEQVRFLLGNPMNLDSFNHDRWVYLYYFKPGHGEPEQKQLILDFINGALTSITGDYQASASFSQGL